MNKDWNVVFFSNLAEPLDEPCGTLGFRGTPVEKHWSRLLSVPSSCTIPNSMLSLKLLFSIDSGNWPRSGENVIGRRRTMVELSSDLVRQNRRTSPRRKTAQTIPNVKSPTSRVRLLWLFFKSKNSKRDSRLLKIVLIVIIFCS